MVSPFYFMDFVRNPFYFFISNEISTTSQHAWSRCYLELAIHSPYMLITKKSYNHMIVKNLHQSHMFKSWYIAWVAYINDICYKIKKNCMLNYLQKPLSSQACMTAFSFHKKLVFCNVFNYFIASKILYWQASSYAVSEI